MSSHKSNLIQMMTSNILEKNDESIEESTAFVRVAAEWMEYDIEEENFVDGAKDRGIDFWQSSDKGFDFIQVKSHKIKSGKLDTTKMDNSGISDLRRIIDLLKEENPPKEANLKIKKLISEWKIEVGKKSLMDEPEPISIYIYLVVFCDALTNQAIEEFNTFKKQNETFTVRNVKVDANINILTIDNLINSKWRQLNHEWKDKNGNTKDFIELTPETDKQNEPQWLPGATNAVFYCKAIDLVTAFSEFGYQIFEPNVRAHIKKSKVNTAIRDSLKHNASRKNFKHLNNGVTLVCKSFSKPSKNKNKFKIIQPGIINGLQTVKSLYDAYSELNDESKLHFETKCYVLIRILTETTVKDVTKVVLATNTQNPMQARNLCSNNEEQIIYERLFAEKGWFFERKQGAWDAYSSDPHRWRSLKSYNKQDFQYDQINGGKRKKYRKVDNEDLAQSWLAFIGCSQDAMHRKRDIFDNELLYKIIFLQRPSDHCYTFDLERRKMQDNCIDESPEPTLMICAELARYFAKQIPISTRISRENAIAKKNLKKGQPKEEIDMVINEDYDFLKARVLNGMSLIFVELFGYVLYKSIGNNIYFIGNKLINTTTFSYIHRYGAVSNINDIRNKDIKSDDVLGLIWCAFDHIIDELLASAWKESFLSAFPRSRFNYSKDTRSRVIKSMDNLDSYMSKTQLTRVWAASIPSGYGFYSYINKILKL